ncbi:unnamed protein product [Amoebophrya sp. A120]|nr:unnamed protein product [Amoebophrya sp. A120]|eukprot:GSA120T00024721001.1
MARLSFDLYAGLLFGLPLRAVANAVSQNQQQQHIAVDYDAATEARTSPVRLSTREAKKRVTAAKRATAAGAEEQETDIPDPDEGGQSEDGTFGNAPRIFLQEDEVERVFAQSGEDRASKVVKNNLNAERGPAAAAPTRNGSADDGTEFDRRVNATMSLEPRLSKQAAQEFVQADTNSDTVLTKDELPPALLNIVIVIETNTSRNATNPTTISEVSPCCFYNLRRAWTLSYADAEHHDADAASSAFLQWAYDGTKTIGELLPPEMRLRWARHEGLGDLPKEYGLHVRLGEMDLTDREHLERLLEHEEYLVRAWERYLDRTQQGKGFGAVKVKALASVSHVVDYALRYLNLEWPCCFGRKSE